MAGVTDTNVVQVSIVRIQEEEEEQIDRSAQRYQPDDPEKGDAGQKIAARVLKRKTLRECSLKAELRRTAAESHTKLFFCPASTGVHRRACTSRKWWRAISRARKECRTRHNVRGYLEQQEQQGGANAAVKREHLDISI